MGVGVVSVHAPTLAAALGAAAGFVGFFLYASVFEYVLHRWLMHRRRRLIPYPYQMHALLHHRVFGDSTYQVQDETDRHAILFEWWQAPVLLAVHSPLPWAAEWITGLPLFWSGMLALAAYYACYEGLHWCMHNPAGRWLERTRLFRLLDAHHRLHHRAWHVNFNVVLPLGDVVFGTLRSARALAGVRPDRGKAPWPARASS